MNENDTIKMFLNAMTNMKREIDRLLKEFFA